SSTERAYPWPAAATPALRPQNQRALAGQESRTVANAEWSHRRLLAASRAGRVVARRVLPSLAQRGLHWHAAVPLRGQRRPAGQPDVAVSPPVAPPESDAPVPQWHRVDAAGHRARGLGRTDAAVAPSEPGVASRRPVNPA